MIKKAFVLIFLIAVSFLKAQNLHEPGQSLFSDLKAHQIGDVITVLIMEQANASRASKVESSSSSDLSAQGSVSGNLTSFLPLFGAASNLANSYDGQEETEQKEKLTGKLSATITEELDNGMLKIEGERTLEINGEENYMKLVGLIRSRDIQTDNTVYSYNVANAQITYRKSGPTRKFLKPGTGSRILTWVLGIGLVGATLLGVLG